MYPSNYIEARTTYAHCLQNKEEYFLSSAVQTSKAMPPLGMSSRLQHIRHAKFTQPDYPIMPMAPFTLTYLIAPRMHILASTRCSSITPEREWLLNRSGVPENEDNRRKCDEVEPLASSSSMDMDPSPSRRVPTTTTMMIQQATRNLEQQEINLRPYKDFISRKLNMS